MNLVPIHRKVAFNFIDKYHSHNKNPKWWLFGVGLEKEGDLIGVGTAMRSASPQYDDGWTLEISRVCVKDRVPNAASKLYGALVRAGKALGYKRIITWTLKREKGTCLSATGFKVVDGGKYSGSNKWHNRPPNTKLPEGQKVLWEYDSEKKGGETKRTPSAPITPPFEPCRRVAANDLNSGGKNTFLSDDGSEK